MKLHKSLFAVLVLALSVNAWTNSTYKEEDIFDSNSFTADVILDAIDMMTASHKENKSKFVSLNHGTPERRHHLSKGQRFISIKTNLRGADVFVNNELKGQTPLKISNLAPGNYTLRVEKDGFAPILRNIRVDDGMGYDYNFYMESIMGRLQLEGLPSGAVILLDDSTTYKTTLELNEGYHRLKVRCFGYDDISATIKIRRHTLKKITVYMQPVEFALTGFTASRTTINPNYRSDFGKITFTASVTAPGSGLLEITDAMDQVVYSQQVPNFYSWQTNISWTGRNSYGQPLPDGYYIATFTAGDYKLSTTVCIDSTLFYHLMDLTYGGTGISNLPQAFSMPAKTIAFDTNITFAWKTNEGFYDIPFTFGLSAWLNSNFELSGKFAGFSKLSISEENKETPVLANISLKYVNNIPVYYGTKLCLGTGIHYGYCSAEQLETPFGNDCGTGLGFCGMIGVDTSRLYAGFTTDFIMGAVSSNPSKGDNTWKNGLAVSLMPLPEVAINLSCAVNSNSNIFDSLEPAIGFSTFIPGLPLMLKTSGQAKIYFDQATYFSGTVGFTYLF